MLTHQDKSHFEEAQKHYQEAKYSEALILLHDITQNNLSYGWTFFEIAKCYLKLGQPKLAMSNFGKAAKMIGATHFYDARKEFATLLNLEDELQHAAEVFMPVAREAKSEEDVIEGVKYLLKTDDIDSAERLLVKHIQSYPNVFDAAMQVTGVEGYAVDRLKNRKSAILKTLKKDIQPQLDNADEYLDYLEDNSDDDVYEGLFQSWDKALEQLDEADSVDKIVAAKANLLELFEQLRQEKIALEIDLEKRDIQALKLQNRSKLSTLNEIDTELFALQARLPDIGLKTEIPAYLSVVRDFKEQILREDVTVVRRAYNNIDNLISEGKFYKEEATKAIERMLQPTELETALVAAQTQQLTTKTKKRRKRDDDVIVIDSVTHKKKRKRRGLVLWLFLGLLLVGGGAYFALSGGMGNEKRVLLTNVFMRQYPDGNAAKVGEESYKTGEALEVLAVEGEWLHIRASDGNEGYMLAEYYGTPAEYTFIEGIFADEKTSNLFAGARYRLTLLEYFKEHNWIGDISDKVEKEIYGDVGGREKYQVLGRDLDARFNTVVLTNLTDYEKYDLVCIISGETDEHLIVYAYQDDNTPIKVYSRILNGGGHDFRVLLDKSDNDYWYLGGSSFGSKYTEKLTQNALLVRMDDYCNHVYLYDGNYMNEYEQGGCE